MRAPLLGQNLVRLIYLDEAGISAGELHLCVAGVIVHGDHEALAVQRKFDEIIERYIPEPDRPGFIFHATDVFHGSGYFERSRWDRITRLKILADMADIIGDLHLPIVAGGYEKATFGIPVTDHNLKRTLIQTTAMMDCAVWADRWLEKYADNENGMIIAEDTDRVKPLIKGVIRMLRTPSLMKASGLDRFSVIPLKRIIDTVHFAAKDKSSFLQLADLCAFILGRAMKNNTVPDPAFSVLFKRLDWIDEYRSLRTAQATAAAPLAEQSSEISP